MNAIWKAVRGSGLPVVAEDRRSTADLREQQLGEDCRPLNFRVIDSILNYESLKCTVPQFRAERIRLQAYWLVSSAKQNRTHSILDAWHDYKIVQADSLFNNFGALIFALEVGIAANASELATQDV
jgi:hypothetical protein